MGNLINKWISEEFAFGLWVVHNAITCQAAFWHKIQAPISVYVLCHDFLLQVVDAGRVRWGGAGCRLDSTTQSSGGRSRTTRQGRGSCQAALRLISLQRVKAALLSPFRRSVVFYHWLCAHSDTKMIRAPWTPCWHAPSIAHATPDECTFGFALSAAAQCVSTTTWPRRHLARDGVVRHMWSFPTTGTHVRALSLPQRKWGWHAGQCKCKWMSICIQARGQLRWKLVHASRNCPTFSARVLDMPLAKNLVRVRNQPVHEPAELARGVRLFLGKAWACTDDSLVNGKMQSKIEEDASFLLADSLGTALLHSAVTLLDETSS